MMYAKDFRDSACQHLGGKWTCGYWSKFAVIILVYFLINIVVSALSYIYIGWVVDLVISGPIALGITEISLRVVRAEGMQTEDFFSGFKNFASAFVLDLVNAIFIFLWSLLLIIPGIIKRYSYSMSFFILRDNPQMSASSARRASMEMMRGNKWRLFCLRFSFIGWFLLSFLTFGILLLWVFPYKLTAEAEFYQSLLSQNHENIYEQPLTY